MKQKYELHVITPVHVGSGEVLSHIDGCYANGRWYHIDLDKVLADPSTDLNALTSQMAQRDFRWERYLKQHNTDLAELSAYSLACPQSPEQVEIREAIKTLGYRPYIPGSTLKGAIRTALLDEILHVDDNVYYKSQNHLKTLIVRGPRGNPRNEKPAQRIEELAFGKDPNHDLLRALHVSDTAPLNSDSLEIGTAWTLTLDRNDQLVQKIERGREYKNFIQHISPGQQLTFSLKIDDLLFRERERKPLHYSDAQEKMLKNIAKVCRSATAQLINDELEFFEYYKLPEIANFYDKLRSLNDMIPGEAFLLQIGWGTGYHTNTVTSLFAHNAPTEPDNEESPETLPWMDLRERFKLGASRSQRGRYDPREFPKTRRILYRGRNPIEPPGWVKISPLED